MRKTLLVMILMCLAGCAPQFTIDPAKSGPSPTAYKAIMAAYIRQNYFDPYTVRDASISFPDRGRMYAAQGWIVCVSANAKNRMGGYTGIHTTAYLLNNGVVIDSDDSPETCLHEKFEPFPEIENLQAKGR